MTASVAATIRPTALIHCGKMVPHTTISKGRIAAIDTTEAEKLPGVVAVNWVMVLAPPQTPALLLMAQKQSDFSAVQAAWMLVPR